MKRIILNLILICASFNVLNALYVISYNYRQWFGEESNMILSKAVECTANGQDLWNGCHVRLVSGYVYVYNGSNRILYGDKVRLIYNGCWAARHGEYLYAYDQEGSRISGVYGNDLYLMSDGRWRCTIGSYVTWK